LAERVHSEKNWLEKEYRLGKKKVDGLQKGEKTGGRGKSGQESFGRHEKKRKTTKNLRRTERVQERDVWR